MVKTVGYEANKEMDDVLFNDALLFREKQIEKASAITLLSAYDEISIYWNEELKYRPGFLVQEKYTKIPVFFAKINGVYYNSAKYWSEIKNLYNEDVFLYKKQKICKIGFLKRLLITLSDILIINNKKLDIKKLKNSMHYHYDSIRPAMQNHILEKIKFVVENKIFKGTFTRGIEHKIISIGLNLPKKILYALHNFDFAKKNPKAIYILTKKETMPIEDAILLVLLHYFGFDVLIFTPGGYNCINEFLNMKILNEFQIGEYDNNEKIPFLWI